MSTALFTSPFEDVEAYLRTHYSPQFYDIAIKAIEALEAFEFPSFYDILTFEINTIQNDDPDVESLSFTAALEDCVMKALQQQGIETPSATFEQKTELLAAVYRSLSPAEPDLYLTVLNTELSNEEILAEILEDFAPYSAAEIMSFMGEIRDETIAAYRELYTKHAEQKIPPEINKEFQEFRENLTAYLKFTADQPTLAYAMAEAGMREGDVMATYYGYITAAIKKVVESNSAEEIARNLLSFFFFCADAYRNPMYIYNRYSEPLGVPPSLTLAVQSEMIRQINLFEQYKKAMQDDTRSVSVL